LSVPFFNYPALYSTRAADFDRVFSDIVERGAFILQDDLREFEQSLAKYVHTTHAIGTGNCTDALSIGIAGMGFEKGAEIIAPSHTFVASVASIATAGLTPELVDIGEDHLLDPAAVEAAIGPRTAAVMAVSLNGRCCDFDALLTICNAAGVALIEDSAQALGATIDGVMAGKAGVFGTYSFYPAKNLGCFGDGGALVTDDPELGRFSILHRDHGRNHETGEIEMFGRNSRLDNLHAAVLNLLLADYDKTLVRRREIAERYHEAFAELEFLLLPHPPEENGRRYDTFQNYELETEHRDALRSHLNDVDIGTALPWGGKGVHQFEALGFDIQLPRTELMFARALMLPMNHLLTDSEVDEVITRVLAFEPTSP